SSGVTIGTVAGGGHACVCFWRRYGHVGSEFEPWGLAPGVSASSALPARVLCTQYLKSSQQIFEAALRQPQHCRQARQKGQPWPRHSWAATTWTVHVAHGLRHCTRRGGANQHATSCSQARSISASKGQIVSIGCPASSSSWMAPSGTALWP